MGPQGQAGCQNSGPGVRLGHSEVWKPQKAGGCTWEECLRNCDLSHVTQDMAKSQFWPTVSPQWGLGWPKRLKMAGNGSWYALCGVSHGPKRYIGTSFVTEGGFNPVGRDHHVVWYCFESFLAIFGLFLPTFGPRGNGAILSSKVTANH